MAVLQPFLAIFVATYMTSFTKLNIRRSFWGAEQVLILIGLKIMIKKLLLVFWEIWRHPKEHLKLTDLYLAQKKRQLFCKSTFQHSVQFLLSIFVNAQVFEKILSNFFFPNKSEKLPKKMHRFVIKRELRNGFNFSTIFLNKTWQQRPDFYNN